MYAATNLNMHVTVTRDNCAFSCQHVLQDHCYRFYSWHNRLLDELVTIILSKSLLQNIFWGIRNVHFWWPIWTFPFEISLICMYSMYELVPQFPLYSNGKHIFVCFCEYGLGNNGKKTKTSRDESWSVHEMNFLWKLHFACSYCIKCILSYSRAKVVKNLIKS